MQTTRFMIPPCYRAPVRAAAVFACVALAAGGCGEDATTSPDLGVGTLDQRATLILSVDGRTRPMAAWYSFYVEPLSDERPPGVYLIVTAVDPAFDCARPSPDLDAVSFVFHDRVAGAYTTTVVSRRGPDLGGTIGVGASAELDAVDDRLGGWDLDGGTVSAGDGGSVAGRLEYRDGTVAVEGAFTATRCATLDFVVPS
jgi:hypothetical protein